MPFATASSICFFSAVLSVGSPPFDYNTGIEAPLDLPHQQTVDPRIAPRHREVPRDPYRPNVAPGAQPVTTPAKVWTRGPYQSVQVNVDAQGNNIVGDAANEPSIAIDPTDPNKIVIGWRQFDSVQSDFRQAGWGYSHDAGRTWTFPGTLTPGVFGSDPVLAADADGVFYYLSINFEQMRLFKSFDGGATWDLPIVVVPRFIDKPWMAIDRTLGIGRGNIYITSGDLETTFIRSTDGGMTFTWFPRPNTFLHWGTLTVGPLGEMYAIGTDGNFVRSSDAKNPSSVPGIDWTASVQVHGYGLGVPPNPAGLLGQPWIVADHSRGISQGLVYVVGFGGIGYPPSIALVRSTDHGESWSEPVRINDDHSDNDAWHWFPTMDVAPNGRIDVVWNDTRNTGLVNMSELFYSFSLDGGATWSENVAVGPVFDSYIGWPWQSKIGDYYHMLSDNGGASLAYAATYNGEQDVFFLRIPADCNGDGVPDQDEIASATSQDCNENGRPDECESDCDGDGIIDYCESLKGFGADCNANRVPDYCDIDAGTSIDCDGNNIPDECQIELTTLTSGVRWEDGFARAVSIHSDHVVVGAPLPDYNGLFPGTAYTFRREGDGWFWESRMRASDAMMQDGFGTSVSIFEDWLVVGAPNTGLLGQSYIGSAYVFRRDGATWVEQIQLRPSDASSGGEFGHSLSLRGNRLVVGAPYVDDACVPFEYNCNSGAVYVFRREGTIWSEEVKLTAADAAGGDMFGDSVALEGDVLVVGASRKNVQGATDAGTSYVFRLVGTTWVQEAEFTANDSVAGDRFGRFVALSGNRALVGAPGNTPSPSTEAAYVFRHEGPIWVEEAKLTTSGANASLGSIAMEPDLILLGFLQTWPDYGFIDVFRRKGFHWEQEARIVKPLLYGTMGISVAVHDNLCVAGAREIFYDDEEQEFETGDAYVFDTRLVGCPCPIGPVEFIDPVSGVVDARQPSPPSDAEHAQGVSTFHVSAPEGSSD